MSPRPSRHVQAFAAATVAALLAGCATTSVKTAGGDTTGLPDALVREVAFDHECQASGLTVLRSNSRGLEIATSYDLNVCGQVRRYKRFGFGESGGRITWLDVTALYPPGTLAPQGK